MVLKNVEIRSYSDEHLTEFTRMFSAYFIDDFNIETTKDKLEKLCIQIAQSAKENITSLDIILANNKIIGFVNYQIDTKKSDWCEREGWGFIREIHIGKDYRGNGLGATLVSHAENILYNQGADKIYLTSDEAHNFWLSCGYTKTNTVSTINNDPIYEK